MTRVYKILPGEAWETAVRAGVFSGSRVDVIDGYIHFSTATQAQATAAKHFAGQDGLVIVAFEAADLGDALRWEPSRDRALFPHLYGVVDPSLALDVQRLHLGEDGTPRIGDLLP